jgi:hypothetical protein
MTRLQMMKRLRETSFSELSHQEMQFLDHTDTAKAV